MLNKSSTYNLSGGHKLKNIVLASPKLVFAVLLALFVSLRFWHITTYSLWGGEAFSMIGVQQSWGDMFTYIVDDIVHPPLFYIILKLWIMIGGDSLLWLKLLPVITGVAVVFPFLLLCRELNFRLPEINLVLFLLAVNGYLIHYAQELRMYSMFMFLAMCSFWLFIRYFKSPGQPSGQLALLAAVNLPSIFTHYYGWVVVGMEFLFLLIWQRQKVLAFGLSMLFLFFCFAPWACLVVQEAHAIGGLDKNLDWIPKPGLTSIVNLYVTFNGPLGARYVKLLGLLIFGMPLLVWALKLVRNGSKQQNDGLIFFSWLALLAFLPVIALFLVSQRMDQAVWMDRYFLFIAIPYMMLVATAAYRLRPIWARNLWIAVIVLFSSLAGFNDLRTNRMAWESPQLGSRLMWDVLVNQMAAAETKTSAPINIYSLTVISKGYRTGDWAISTSIDYFLDLIGDYRFQIRYARDAQALLDQTEEDHFWVAFFELEEWPVTSPSRVLTDNGYRVEKELVFQQQNNVNKLVLLQTWRE
jgi:uncharacterized membrane protein